MKKITVLFFSLAAFLTSFATPIMAESVPDTANKYTKLVSDFPMEILIFAIVAVLLLCVALFFIFRKKK